MNTDFLVIGSGVAGLNFALEACRHGRVLICTKSVPDESNSRYAQGGIAAVVGADDTPDLHVEDTLKAGSFHNNRPAVELLAARGRAAITTLERHNTPFTRNPDGTLKLSREGGHCRARIVYAGDSTGKAMVDALLAAVQQHPEIELRPNTRVIDLIMHDGECRGAWLYDGAKILAVTARAVILATGGAGQVFAKTTNPATATGDGIALAARAGAETADLEFVQFHPTALDLPGVTPFLISEAVRGEGGILLNSDRETFMARYHEMGDLAPRDVVARAIVQEARKGQVYLDVRHFSEAFLHIRFPLISLRMHGFDLDPQYDLLPVSPAAHYLCGGVKTDLLGRTSVPRLFAIGETACTGVHGANRLASNSLLEAMVFSVEAARTAAELPALPELAELPDSPDVLESPKPAGLPAPSDVDEVRRIMWEHVGLQRSTAGLNRALADLAALEAGLPPGFSPDLAETRSLITVGSLIAAAALARPESLGCHWRSET